MAAATFQRPSCGALFWRNRAADQVGRASEQTRGRAKRPRPVRRPSNSMDAEETVATFMAVCGATNADKVVAFLADVRRAPLRLWFPRPCRRAARSAASAGLFVFFCFFLCTENAVTEACVARKELESFSHESLAAGRQRGDGNRVLLRAERRGKGRVWNGRTTASSAARRRRRGLWGHGGGGGAAQATLAR